MDFAIIVKKDIDGSIAALRSTIHPPTQVLETQARALDSYLQQQTSVIERKLARANLFDAETPRPGDKVGPGKVILWHALGTELAKMCKKVQIVGRRERRWLWEAIENLYASDRIKRASRGKTRNHFEYCYRLAQFPKNIAERINWSEWVYFFDSRTVREESRADKWLLIKAKKTRNIDRRFFRRFTENLNRRIKKLDTSVLKEAEIFQLYDSVWAFTKKEIGSSKAH